MRERSSIAVLWWCGSLLGCFDPQVDDGAVRCGEAGCPPDQVCSADDVCRVTAGDSENVVLAIAREDAPSEVHAFCAGAVVPAWTLDAVGSARTVAWGALHDGRQDLAVGSIYDDLRLFAIDGDRLELTWAIDWLQQARSAGWADYDQDGDLDLAVSDGEYSLKVLEQRRDGLEPDWRAEDMTDPWGLAWGDRDGDGDLDLAVASAATVAVYKNTGDDGGGGGGGGGGRDNTFERVWTSPRQEATRSVAWADLDRDGDQDLVVGALAGPVRVYTNDGAGNLGETWASASSGDTPSVALGDFDRDGDLDLAAAGRDQPTRVYRNVDGALVPAWATEASESTWSVDWFDIDGDGDLDLTLGNHDQPSRVLRNNRGTLVPWMTLEVDRVRELRWARWPVAADRPSACDQATWR